MFLRLAVKDQDSQENRTKREFLKEWVEAVNAHGGFGEWTWDVSRNPADVSAILAKHGKAAAIEGPEADSRARRLK